MRKWRRRKPSEEEGENLTPLIDCVFLLLIFFMVTTVFKQPYSLQVELPLARHAKEVEEKKLVGSITVDDCRPRHTRGKRQSNPICGNILPVMPDNVPDALSGSCVSCTQ